MVPLPGDLREHAGAELPPGVAGRRLLPQVQRPGAPRRAVPSTVRSGPVVLLRRLADTRVPQGPARPHRSAQPRRGRRGVPLLGPELAGLRAASPALRGDPAALDVRALPARQRHRVDPALRDPRGRPRAGDPRGQLGATRGPDWESFSLRWPEDDAARLPRALEALEAQAGEMGMRARAAYESFFAPDVVLARQLSQLEALVVTARPGRFPSGGYHNAQYLHLRARELRGAARHGAVDIARAGARTPLPRPASHRAGRRSSQPGESVSVPEPDPALRPRRRAVPQIAISSPVRTASAARSVRATSVATVETRIERSSRSDQFST